MSTTSTLRPSHSAAAVRCLSCGLPSNVTVGGICFACIGKDLERKPRTPARIPNTTKP